MTTGKARTIRVSEAVGNSVRYDLIGDLVNETGLTRKTIVEVLKGIKPATFAQFKMNPEEFIIKTANIINDAKAIAVIQKIAYERSTNTYDMDIFTESTIWIFSQKVPLEVNWVSMLWKVPNRCMIL